MIDTHAHLYLDDYAADRADTIARAKAAGVEQVFLPATDKVSCEQVLLMCEEFPGYCRAMLGLHPEDVNADYATQLSEIYNLLKTRLIDHDSSSVLRPIAIGEIGLDYYWSREYEAEQQAAFIKQVEWAAEFNLPLMIHCRKAQNELVVILRQIATQRERACQPPLSGVFHCFTGNEQEARQLLEFPNFMLGIGGVLTFKKSTLPETLHAAVPLDRIVLETDAPYMAPVPLRGQRNESTFVVHVCNKLAEIYATTPEQVARITTANAKRIFKL